LLYEGVQDAESVKAVIEPYLEKSWPCPCREDIRLGRWDHKYKTLYKNK
jgi:hypothetical protein